MLFDQSIYGLDVGSHSIKLFEFFDRKKTRIKRALVEKLECSLFSDNEFSDTEVVKDVLKEFFIENRFRYRYKKAAISLPSGSYKILKKSYSVKDFEELKDQIFFDTRQIFSENRHSLSFRFRILNNYGSFDKDQDVILVAINSELVETYLELLKEIGVKVSIVDCPQFALANLAEYYNYSNSFNIILNIGAKFTDIIISEKNNLLNTKTYLFGGNTYTEQISKDLEISFDEAEALKINLDQESTESTAKNKILTSISSVNYELAKIVSSNTNDYLLSIKSEPEKKIEEVILCGGGSIVSGLDSEIASVMDCRVSYLNNFFDPDSYEKQNSVPLNNSNIVSLCHASGMAIRNLIDWIG